MKVVQYIRVNHYFRNVAFVSSVLLFILVTLLCLPISSGEQDTLAATNQGDSITINFTNNTASVDLSVNNADGTFATSSTEDKAAFSISTDNASGYTLSISSNDDTGELTSGTSSFTSIDSAISSTTFDNSSYNGKWGYLPSKYNSTDNTNYLPSPTTDISILDITSSANATANNYTIALGARTDYSNAIGNYSKTFTLTSIANIIPESCNNSKLCIEYDANGLYYVNPNTTMNRVNYNSTTTQEEMTKYSHTSNIDDAGTKSGSYPSSQATKDVITIPGASTLHAAITYGTEDNRDMLYVFQGEYTGTIGRNMNQSSTGWLYKYMGGRNTTTTVEIDIPGDTATFGFYSDGSSQYYGYYAVVTGTGTTYTRSVYSGSYIVPTASSAQTFRGWSTSEVPGGIGHESDVEYLDEAAVMASIPEGVGETKTLYAVWQQAYPVTITKDDNVSGVTILDSSGNTVSTITESSQSVPLYLGDTYTIKPTHTTGYTTNTITKTSGDGTLSGSNADKKFTVGAGAATISVTSKVMQPMQNWTGCSSLAVGDTEQVYDTRDNEIYLVGKLKDNKCWMLENLNIAGGTALSATDTDVDSGYISSFTTSNRLTKTGNTIVLPASSTSGFNADNYSYVYNSGNKTNCGASGQNTLCYSYYSWDAATLGSGRTIKTDNTDAPYSICPKGWRLPTAYSTSASNWQTADFYALAHQYGLDSTTSTSEEDNGFYTQAGPGTVPNFLLAGYYAGGSFLSSDLGGYYWSATSYSNMDSARSLRFYSGGVYSANSNTLSRYYGRSVRCLLMSTNTYTLNYDKNTTDTVSNMPSSQSATIQNDKLANFTISTDNVPSRSGYVFAGWGTSSDQAEPTYKYNNGTFTPSEATVYANDNPETLYAIWYIPREITFNIDSNVSSVQILDSSGNVASTVTTTGTKVNLMEPATYTIKPTHTAGYGTNTITKTSGAGTLNGKEFTVGADVATIDITSKALQPMQNWTGCSSLAVGDTEQVYDTRDNEIYLVGKLKDNKCWMLENLNIAGGTALSATDTNVDSGYISSFTTSNNLTKNGDTIVLPTSSTSGFDTNDYSYVYNSGNKTNCGASGQNTPCYSYYSWDAATLGSGRTIKTDNTDAPYSICPKGWRLPTAYTTSATNWQTTSDFYVLAHQYGLDSTTITSESDNGFYTQAGPGTVPNFLLAGYYNSSSSFYNSGPSGYYWSATSYSSTDNARYLYFYSSYVTSSKYGYRRYGSSVRCLLAE